MELMAHDDEKSDVLAAHRAGLPTYPDGPILEQFDPVALAQLIDQECLRTSHLPRQKIDLRMDPEDALKLARFLRYRGLG